MKPLSPPMRAAYEALKSAPRNSLSSGGKHGIRRTTMEALARRGLVEVVSTPNVHLRTIQVDHTTFLSRRAGLRWTAWLLPPHPSTAALSGLDRKVRNSGAHRLTPAQRRVAAYYCAVSAPVLALRGSAASLPTYSIREAYDEYAQREPDRLIDVYRATRTLRDGVSFAPASQSAPSGVWALVNRPGPGRGPRAEFGRVRARNVHEALLRANQLLGRVGGYRLLDLSEHEARGWIKDFMCMGSMLRIMLEPGTGYAVSLLRGNVPLLARDTAEAAEDDARTHMLRIFQSDAA